MKTRVTIPWGLMSTWMVPLSYLIYYILKDSLGEQSAFGVTGVLIVLSFSQFFFLRRNLLFSSHTLVWFYVFGVISALIMGYTQWEGLVLVELFIFYKIIEKTSLLTSKGETVTQSIEKEEKERKWYVKLWATKTQQQENGYFIVDFFVVAVCAISLVYIYDLYYR